MNKLPASTGWAWLKQGAGLFRKQPAALTTLLFANILISVAIGSVPYLGALLTVLIPSFTMAFMQACLMIENNKRVSPAVLLTGFRKPAITSLLKVGLIYLGVSVVLTLLTRLAIDPDFLKMMSGPIDPKDAATVSVSDLLGLLFISVLDVAALMVLCFAAPLTYWQKMSPGKATFYSFFAVIKSARVFVILLLAWFGILLGTWLVIAMIFGSTTFSRVLLTWIAFLFMLLLQCAIYAGYRQIFGVPSDAEAQPTAWQKP